jgi:hypothetical protein
MGSFKPTTYLTIEELQQIVVAKFEEAAGLPDGPQREAVLKSAQTYYYSQVRMMRWLLGELQPPK